MRIVMGECKNCGRIQPCETASDSLEPLREDGCADCGNDNFTDVEDRENYGFEIVQEKVR